MAEDDSTVALPSYDGGGRVERTGIALVHEGEYVVPAVGGEAILSPHGDSGTVINFHFPVEVQVVGALSDSHVQQVATHVFSEFERELTSRL
ncbi:hypothetical protein ABZU94_37120 [Streptomyces mirabilis]|uniref:hypothetical protein n=1 Tax=unclassified Streptomyces TaxID=2593676 RepID=UPI000EADB0BA|nr:hypothetical protein [Streptomyces sp. 3211.6]RKT08178.1 hypothetical protein BX286_6262 [Streptomyces sp. 3211.6]